MPSKLRKWKRRKLNRKRKRLREKMFPIEENLRQQRLRAEKKPKLRASEMKRMRNREKQRRKRMRKQIAKRAIQDEENLQQQIWRDMAVNHNVYAHYQENVQEQRWMYVNYQDMAVNHDVYSQIDHYQENVQEQKWMDFPVNHNFYAHAPENLQQQRWMEMHAPDLEEQRQRDIQRREAYSRLDQMQATVSFDERSRPVELIREFGFRDSEGL